MLVPDLSEDRTARRARKRAVVVKVEFAETDGKLSTKEGPVPSDFGVVSGPVFAQTYELLD